MCGIVALTPPDGVTVEAALEALAHRGPDHVGDWRAPSEGTWLGHRRLSIVDLSPQGNQPMHNENQQVWLVGNGEIYNSPSLRTRLEGLGHRFYSQSDNEVILHAYESWGEKCVDYLEGMFAFVLWDEQKRLLLAARDPVGMKPLYYAQQNGRLALASEAGAVLRLLDRRPAVEAAALAYVMTLGYIPCPWSIWQGIHKLEPGHRLTWQPDEENLKIEMYWEPPRELTGSLPTAAEFQAQFEPLLNEHLLADVPLGLFLSGGIDSTTVALGLHHIGRPVQALTVGMVDSDQDETAVAAATAHRLNLEHRAIPLSTQDVTTLIGQVTGAFDEPQGYSALLSMYLISQAAAESFKVVLAGDGGDELFGGYTWYQNLEQPVSRTAPWWRRLLRPVIKRKASPGLRQYTASRFAQCSVLHRHAWRLYPRFLPEEAEFLLAPMGLHFEDQQMLAPLRQHFEPGLPLKQALQRVDLMTFCTDSILAKVDRASMAHSLEARVPFLDRRMIDWAMTRPLSSSGPASKQLLRDYLTSWVPGEVLRRPKQGFSLRGLETFDWEAAVGHIGQGPWVRQGYWSDEWQHMVEPDVPNRQARIWNLLMLTRWAEAWLI